MHTATHGGIWVELMSVFAGCLGMSHVSSCIELTVWMYVGILSLCTAFFVHLRWKDREWLIDDSDVFSTRHLILSGLHFTMT